MKLKSFGCSFIWGSEMPDCTIPKTDIPVLGNPPSQYTWPARLSRELKLKYECHAWPGRGNFFVASQVLDQLARNESALYVINWTWIDRFDFKSTDTSTDSWQTLMPGKRAHEHADFYYRNLHSELRDKMNCLQLIKLVTLELLASGQPFIMTYMDHLIFDQQWHVTPGMLKQQEFVRPLMLHWEIENHDPMNWSGWAAQQGHELSEYYHLLASGHELVFQNVLNRLQCGAIPTASQAAIDKIKTA